MPGLSADVINARIRRRTGLLVPLPAPAWSEQVAETGGPERQAYLTEIAALMDARKERIGEHAAAAALPWAVAALGPAPGDPAACQDWQYGAAAIGAYRELSGYDDPADPVGPEPAANSPDLRAAWHEALAAFGPVDGPDVRGITDGLLLRLRDTYPLETAWAPPWTGDELRQARAGAQHASLAALRATAEAGAAQRRGKHEEANHQMSLAASYQAMHDAYRQRATALAAAMDDRVDWERATRRQRQIAVAADAELRRRHPAEPWPPLRSAEPELESGASRQDATATARLIEALAARHREFTAKLTDRQSIKVPAEDPDYGDLTPAFPAWSPPAETRSSSRPSPRSPRRRESWNGPPSGTGTWKLAADYRVLLTGTGQASHHRAGPRWQTGGPGCPPR